MRLNIIHILDKGFCFWNHFTRKLESKPILMAAIKLVVLNFPSMCFSSNKSVDKIWFPDYKSENWL